MGGTNYVGTSVGVAFLVGLFPSVMGLTRWPLGILRRSK